MALPAELRRCIFARFSAERAEHWPLRQLREWLRDRYPAGAVPAALATPYLHNERELLWKIAAWHGEPFAAAQLFLPHDLTLLTAAQTGSVALFRQLCLSDLSNHLTLRVVLRRTRSEPLVAEQMLAILLERLGTFDYHAITAELLAGDAVLTPGLLKLLAIVAEKTSNFRNFIAGVLTARKLPLGEYPMLRNEAFFDGFAVAQNGVDLNRITITSDKQAARIGRAGPFHEVPALEEINTHLLEQWLVELAGAKMTFSSDIINIRLRSPRLLQRRAARMLQLLPQIYQPNKDYQHYATQLEFIVTPNAEQAQQMSGGLALLFGYLNNNAIIHNQSIILGREAYKGDYATLNELLENTVRPFPLIAVMITRPGLAKYLPQLLAAAVVQKQLFAAALLLTGHSQLKGTAIPELTPPTIAYNLLGQTLEYYRITQPSAGMYWHNVALLYYLHFVSQNNYDQAEFQFTTSTEKMRVISQSFNRHTAETDHLQRRNDNTVIMLIGVTHNLYAILSPYAFSSWLPETELAKVLPAVVKDLADTQQTLHNYYAVLGSTK